MKIDWLTKNVAIHQNTHDSNSHDADLAQLGLPPGVGESKKASCRSLCRCIFVVDCVSFPIRAMGGDFLATPTAARTVPLPLKLVGSRSRNENPVFQGGLGNEPSVDSSDGLPVFELWNVPRSFAVLALVPAIGGWAIVQLHSHRVNWFSQNQS